MTDSENLTEIRDGTDFLQVNPEFIEENKKINLVKPSKKFAPYSRAVREKRRKEVQRLHFELGMPAVKIADLMQVDKNTIYSDLRAIYLELAQPNDFINDFVKFLVRLEAQRGRLVEYLSKVQDIQIKLMIERQITDIDVKLVSTSQRIEESAAVVMDRVSKSINEYSETQKLDHRVVTLQQILRLTPDAYRGVLNIMRKFSSYTPMKKCTIYLF